MDFAVIFIGIRSLLVSFLATLICQCLCRDSLLWSVYIALLAVSHCKVSPFCVANRADPDLFTLLPVPSTVQVQTLR